MKLTNLERISIAVTALALAAMIGFFLGADAGMQRITTQLSNLSLSPSQTQPSRQNPLPEPSPALQETLPEPEETPAIRFPLDLNTATAEELQALPGIGTTRAQAIVDYRAEHGPFRYVEDLRGVSGIGEGTLAKIMDYVTIGEANNG